MISLRKRLLLYVGLGQLLLLALLNLGLWNLAEDIFTQDFDERLAIQAKSMASLIDQEGPYVEFDYKHELSPRFEREERPDYYQIWVEKVGVLDRSKSLGEGDLEQRGGTAQVPEHWNADLPDGREGRFAGIRFPIGEYVRVAEDGKTAGRCTAVLVMGSERAPIVSEMARFGTGLLILDLLIGIGSGLVVWFAVKRGLIPVLDLAQRVETIETSEDALALSNIPLPRELLPLANSVGTLHQRLLEAVLRERRLSGHIAHELRTPISELRTLSEVALANAEDAQGLLFAAEQARDVSIEMEHTVAMLLRIWRQQAAEANGDGGSVDIRALMEELQGRVKNRTRDRELVWQGQAGDPIIAHVQRKPLELVLSNLMDNAVEHSPHGSQLQWKVLTRDGVIQVEIENPVSQGVPPPADPETRHAGLGLSLSRRVSSLTGFDLHIDRSQNAWLSRLSVPMAREVG